MIILENGELFLFSNSHSQYSQRQGGKPVRRSLQGEGGTRLLKSRVNGDGDTGKTVSAELFIMEPGSETDLHQHIYSGFPILHSISRYEETDLKHTSLRQRSEVLRCPADKLPTLHPGNYAR